MPAVADDPARDGQRRSPFDATTRRRTRTNLLHRHHQPAVAGDEHGAALQRVGHRHRCVGAETAVGGMRQVVLRRRHFHTTAEHERETRDHGNTSSSPSRPSRSRRKEPRAAKVTPPAQRQPPRPGSPARSPLEVVREAITQVKAPGRFGDRKVFISALWRRVGPKLGMSIDELKQWCAVTELPAMSDARRRREIRRLASSPVVLRSRVRRGTVLARQRAQEHS